ncbi:MAG: Gfo/Idh/MocA family protein [Micromonosporaceae bacterium]
MSELRIAVVGVGDVAQRDYLPEAHRLAGEAAIVAVASRSIERARMVAESYGIPRWTSDWTELLDDRVDAVVNLTPIAVHREITLAAIEAGKHVYSEKPLAMSPSDGEVIRAAAQRTGVTVVAAPSICLFPQITALDEIVRNGELGAIHSARAHVFGGTPPWEGYLSDPSPFFNADGGPLRDMAVYPLHALTGLFGPVRRVSAFSQRTRTFFTPAEGPYAGRAVPVESDDDWQLLLQLDAGVVATVQANFCARSAAGPELELHGETGAAGVSLLDVAEPLQLLSSDADDWTDIPVHAGRAEGPDHILGVRHLAECVRDGRQPLVSMEHAIHVLDVIAAAEESAATGAAVSPATGFPWTRPGPTPGTDAPGPTHRTEQ